MLLIGAAAEKIESQIATKVQELLALGVGPLPLGAAHSVAASFGFRNDSLRDDGCAVGYAREHAHRGDTVLLAPACASFDQFENYEHRGRVFKQIGAGDRMARLRTDWILFLTILAMVGFGLVMLYSASSAVAELRYHVPPYHFVVRQLVFAVGSFALLMYFKRRIIGA